MSKFSALNLLAFLCLSTSTFAAQDKTATKDEIDAAKRAAHSARGHMFDAGPRQEAILLPGMPSIQFSSNAKNQQALKFILQGIGQLHGFADYEAERSFRTAEKLEPNCLTAFWGMAMANTIFFTGSKHRAYAFLKYAQDLRANKNVQVSCNSQFELALLDSAWALYQPALASTDADGVPTIDENKLNRQGHIDALLNIMNTFPKETEAKAFYALFLWFDNEPMYSEVPLNSPDMENGVPQTNKKIAYEVHTVLEDLFAESPLHPAHHYSVHLYNGLKLHNGGMWTAANGTTAKAYEFALESAARIGASGPGIAHLWHMAIHIYNDGLRMKDDWRWAFLWNTEAAQRVEHKMLNLTRETPLEIHNYVHNADWFITKLTQAGDLFKAESVALALTKLPMKNWDATANAKLGVGGNTPVFNNGEAFGMGLYHLASITQMGLGDRIADIEMPVDSQMSDAATRFIAYSTRALAQLARGNDSAIQGDIDLANQALAKMDSAAKAKASAEVPEFVLAQTIFSAIPAMKTLHQVDPAIQLAATNQLTTATNMLKKADALDIVLHSIQRLVREAVQTGSETKAKAALSLVQYFKVKPAGFAVETMTSGGDFRLLGQLLEMKTLLRAKEDTDLVDTYVKSLAQDWMKTTLATRMDNPFLKRMQELNPTLINTIANKFSYDRRFQSAIAPRPLLDKMGPLVSTPLIANTTIKIEGRSNPTLIVFEMGPGCIACSQQAKDIVDRIDEFSKHGIDVVLVAPDKFKAIEVPKKDGLISITASERTFKSFRVSDDFEVTGDPKRATNSVLLHGMFLVNSKKQILWQDIGSKPYNDIPGFISEAERLLRIWGR